MQGPPPPPAPDQAQARATPPAGAAAAASSAPDIFMMEGPQEGKLPLQLLTHTLDAAAAPAVPDPAFKALQNYGMYLVNC